MNSLCSQARWILLTLNLAEPAQTKSRWRRIVNHCLIQVYESQAVSLREDPNLDRSALCEGRVGEGLPRCRSVGIEGYLTEWADDVRGCCSNEYLGRSEEVKSARA